MSLSAWEFAPTLNELSDLGSLQYVELHRTSGKSTFAPGNSNATRVFAVKWANYVSFVDDVLGYGTWNGGTGITRVLPDSHPDMPLFYAINATVEPMGESSLSAGIIGTGNASSWDIAVITVTYQPVTYLVKADGDVTSELQRFTTRTWSFSNEYFTTNGAMKFVSNGQPMGRPPARITGAIELQIVWHDVPVSPSNPAFVPNRGGILNCLGRVNSSTFDVGFGSWTVGTVLFAGAEPKLVTPRLGSDLHTWEITHKFVIRDNGSGGYSGDQLGHNYVWNQRLGDWDLITHNGLEGGNRLYLTADFAQIFQIS